MSGAPATLVVAPGGVLRGRALVPGDKSISHRAALLGALAVGETRIDGFLRSDDCLALLAALGACGISHSFDDEGTLVIQGRARWRAPSAPLDLANSGTAMRLLAGALAGQEIDAQLIGDASLSRRPMERIAAPLRALGAEVVTTDGTPPLRIRGRRPLGAIDWTPVAPSAQVKSAILLAGLAAEGAVVVREPAPTSDHTERMLAAFGVTCAREDGRVILGAAREPKGALIRVPGDFSSAAFLIAGAAMTPGSELTLEGIGLNPTRTAMLEVLRAMGADITVERTTADAVSERAGRIHVRGRALVATTIDARSAQQAIDELPMLMVVAATARGTTQLEGAGELRHKESDRLAVTAAGLAALGVGVDLHAEGMTVHGSGSVAAFAGGTVDAHDDHRIAMAFAMAALCARAPITITRAAAIATSFPSFHRVARDAGLALGAAA